MNTKDDSYVAHQEKPCTEAISLKDKWWHILDNWKVGIVPLPLFILAGVLICISCLNGKLSSSIVVMTATLAFFGFACGEFGKRLPYLGKIGAAAICATFIPSMLVYYGWLPEVVVKSTTAFYKSTDILYLYICCVIVGSIMSMNRTTLIRGFFRIIFPMVCGEIVGMTVGVAVGTLLGMTPFQTFFFLVLPIMAGGVGEGAIPLSIGYATILHMDQGVALGKVLPIVMLGGLSAVVMAGCLNQLGKRFPHLTGNGELLQDKQDNVGKSLTDDVNGKVDVTAMASGALLAVLLYILGMLIQKYTSLPAPVGMLFIAVLLKVANAISPRILEGSQVVYKFFQTAVTYPVLFAVGVAITPWHDLVSAFTISNVIVIISTVAALTLTGALVGRKLGMHPIDVAVISCCQSGQGGTGAVAILSAADRMSLMPFAQIAIRVGGALNVSLSLLILSNFIL
ncbi:2-hydroxycarboxylate transporter family protein [Candidatus Symbiopectobacterium sp.]|uniref:2-hydroxycarboxylate transporter family protein n=1 Tax=Candidatus Symbiopectobacterium sp. TaxID=2816440 RepID=UPI0025BA48C3|nr:2-hydroxycarboxylate transporter family protein [Candidatus Symbiopectobacterium sp.]